jgi:hypothetical protein
VNAEIINFPKTDRRKARRAPEQEQPAMVYDLEAARKRIRRKIKRNKQK